MEYALDYLDKPKNIQVQKENEMKDVYSCWVGFVAIFIYGLEKKKKKKQEMKKKTHVIWFGHEFM